MTMEKCRYPGCAIDAVAGKFNLGRTPEGKFAVASFCEAHAKEAERRGASRVRLSSNSKEAS